MTIAEAIDHTQIRKWTLKLQQLIVESDEVPDLDVKIKHGRYDKEMRLQLKHPCVDTYLLFTVHNNTLKLPDPIKHGEFYTNSVNDQADVDWMLKLAVLTSLASAFDGRGYSLKLRVASSVALPALITLKALTLIIEFGDHLECSWELGKIVIRYADKRKSFKSTEDAAKFINDY
jgi:hypothetical protein